jgi:succinate dehydrogenase/fumarate reductase flavoprotein subunit
VSDSYDVIVIGSGAALTAMANALRVGDHMIERLGTQQPQKEATHVG